MESSNENQQQQLNKDKDRHTTEEKDMKAKRKIYGKIFVSLIFFLILYEYYVYVYQIMWPRLKGRQFLNLL
jgi:hypothetical protein